MSVMTRGSVVEMKSAKISVDNMEFCYKAKNSRKGDRLVFIYLGHQEGSDELDAEAILRDMGWIPKEEAQK